MDVFLKKILFILIFIIGSSLICFAQNDNRNTPPKEKPPIIPAKPKDTQKPPNDNSNKDNNSNKPKKPSAEFLENSLIPIYN